jgi:hypothetical protein
LVVVLSGSAFLGLALGASGLVDRVEATYLWGLYAYLATCVFRAIVITHFAAS